MADPPTGWSDSQLRTLADLSRPSSSPPDDGEARRHAELAAVALSEVAEPADLRQVRLTLSLLGSRLGAPVLAQRQASSRRGHAARLVDQLRPQRSTFSS